MQHVTLIDRETDRIEIHLTAEITPKGDVLLSGQDLGPAVEEIWGDDDYEYRLTVPSEQKDRVLAGLARIAFQDAGLLRSWLDSRGILYSSGSEGKQGFLFEIEENSTIQDSNTLEGKEEFLIEVKGNFTVRDSEAGTVLVVREEHKDRMLVLLLAHLFEQKVFRNDSEVSTWLESTNIPYEFNRDA